MAEYSNHLKNFKRLKYIKLFLKSQLENLKICNRSRLGKPALSKV